MQPLKKSSKSVVLRVRIKEREKKSSLVSIIFTIKQSEMRNITVEIFVVGIIILYYVHGNPILVTYK